MRSNLITSQLNLSVGCCGRWGRRQVCHHAAADPEDVHRRLRPHHRGQLPPALRHRWQHVSPRW